MLPYEELRIAFDEADNILAGYSEEEVHLIAAELFAWMQGQPSMPPLSNTKSPVDFLDPRRLYSLMSAAHFGTSIDMAQLRQQMAAATLVALGRVSSAHAAAKNDKSWMEAAAATSSARAFAEWTYMLDTVIPDSDVQSGVIDKTAVRAAAKEKIKKAKSAAAKKGWRKTYKADKEMVIGYYEQHKGGFKNLSDAANQIYKKNLVPLKHSTIYTWLGKHVKKSKK